MTTSDNEQRLTKPTLNETTDLVSRPVATVESAKRIQLEKAQPDSAHLDVRSERRAPEQAAQKDRP